MKKLLIFCLLIFGILLSACSSSSNNAEEGQPSTSEVLVKSPTSTVTVTPSPTPEPTPLPEVRITLAENSFFEGDYQTAENELDFAKSTSNDQNILASANVRSAQILIQEGLYSEALNLLSPILDDESIENEIKASANYFYAICQENLNNPTEAAVGYAGYISYLPGTLDAYMYEKAGDVLYNAQILDQALEYYNLALESSQILDLTDVKINIGKIYAAQLDYTNAIRIFMEVHDSSPSEYVRSQMNLLAGQSYLALGLPDQAYARFQESVQNFPRAYDTHSGLVALVEAGIQVDEFNRGLSNYYTGNYGLAINAFLRFIEQTPDHNGSSFYFIGMSYLLMDDPDNAIFYFDQLIDNYPDNMFFVDAWDEKAYTQWAYLNQYPEAAETLLEFANEYPGNDYASEAIMEAGRIYERNNQLTKAANTWAQLIDLYPQMVISSQALFLSGITNYRLENYDIALSEFQRYLLLTGVAEEKAAGFFWVGKTYEKLGETEKAKNSWQEATSQDPNGYYSERAEEILLGHAPLTTVNDVNLTVNLEQERMIAEVWMRNTFAMEADTNFITMTSFGNDENFIRANAFWNLGLYEQARNEYENLRTKYAQDPLNLFRLTNHFIEIGLYRSAIYSSRQILDLAGMNDFTSFEAPLWFNHIRFGIYFEDIVQEAAADYEFDPMLIFSLIRQESFFEGFIISSAGAKGLMQIMPATGEEIASLLRWPANYKESDLYRPIVNIRMGTNYLSRMRTYFDNDIFAAMAAYNAGPGNVLNWLDKAHNDPDLFLEIIPYEETQRYLRNIYTFFRIYETLYQVRTAE